MRRPFALCLVGLCMVFELVPESLASPPAIGQPAPPFALTLLDGTQLALKQFLGKAVLINFWAST